MPIAGMMKLPEIAHLAPGVVRKISISPDLFLYVPEKESRSSLPLTTLTSFLKDGYRVQVLFKTNEEAWKTWKLSADNQWVGRIISGDFDPSAFAK